MKKLFILISLIFMTNIVYADVSANTELKDLTPLDAGSVATGDLLYVNDITGDLSKKIPVGALLNSAVGGLTGLSDVSAVTQGAGKIMISDGTYFDSLSVSGDVTLAASGSIQLGSGVVGATELSASGVSAGSYTAPTVTVDTDGRITYAASGGLTGLSDVSVATQGTGKILISDGTYFDSLSISGDVTLAASGAIAIQTGVVGSDELAATSVTTATYQSPTITVDADGRLLYAASGGLTGLSDVSVATQGTGKILISDGTYFDSLSVSGDVTIAASGATAIQSGVVGATELAATDVVAASYQSPHITVDADGRLIYAASGGLTGLSDVSVATQGTGRMLISDGTYFDSLVMSGSCTLAASGVITCASSGELEDLSDVSVVTQGAGRILISDGTKFDSLAMSGSCTLDAGGVATCVGGSVTELEDLTDVSVVTQGAGRLLISDGTKFDALAMSGDCTIDAGGVTTCAGGGALSDLSDVGTAGATNAGYILVAEGTEYEGVEMTGDTTISATGVIDIAATSVSAGTYTAPTITVGADGRLLYSASGGLTGLTDVGSDTQGAGRLLINDGTSFQSIVMSGDCTIDKDGLIDCPAGAVTELDDLSDVSSSTQGEGRLLVSDGTDFESIVPSGSCTVDKDGVFTCSGGASELVGLSDVTSSTQGWGRLLVSDGTDFTSINTTTIDRDTGELTVGTGSSGSIDMGTNTLTDDILANVLWDYKDFSVQASNPASIFVTTHGAITAAAGSYSLGFDQNQDEQGIWDMRMPTTFGGTVPVLKFQYTTTDTGNDVIFDASVQCTADGEAVHIDTSSFHTANSVTDTVGNTAGMLNEVSLTLTNFDSGVAGEHCTFLFNRDADNVADDTPAEVYLKTFMLEWLR